MSFTVTPLRRSLAAASIAMLIAGSAVGQTAVPLLADGAAPAGAPDPSKQRTPAGPGVASGVDPADPSPANDARSAVLPEVQFNETPIEDIVEYFQDVTKTYRAVVVRRVPKDAGPLITMRIKGASVDQLLRVIMAAHPEVSLMTVDGPGGAIDVISVQSQAMIAPGIPGMGGMAPGAEMGFADALMPAQPIVRVYRLTGIVATMVNPKNVDGGDRAKLEKSALADILSLVKATMETVGGREPPKLQLHEETSTLIFSGSPGQQHALEDVLMALETDEAVRAGSSKERATANEVRRLEAQLKDARTALDQARQDAVLIRTELGGVQRQSDTQLQELIARNHTYRDQIEQLQAEVRRVSQQQQGEKGGK